MRTVYPVYSGPNVVFVPGIPAIEQTLSDKDAKALVDTGAFTYDKPKPAPKPTVVDDTESEET